MFEGIKAKYAKIKEYSKEKESLRFASMEAKTMQLKKQNKIKANLEKEKSMQSKIKMQTRERKLAPIRKIAKDIRSNKKRRSSGFNSPMFQGGGGSRNIFDNDNKGGVFEIGKPKMKKRSKNKSIIIKIN